MMNTHPYQRGFTLIELLLYVTIVGSLLIAISLFVSLSVDAQIKHQSISEVDQQGTLVIGEITRALRSAEAINSPLPGASDSTLSVAVPTAVLSPTIFSLNGTTLELREGSAAATALTNDKVVVTNLIFRNLSRSSTPGSVQVSLTLSRVNPENRSVFAYEKTFVTTVSLRQQ